MRDLGWIIKSNEEAAGREAAHAFNDGDHRKANKIVLAGSEDLPRPANAQEAEERAENWDAFIAGYEKGREEN